MIILFGICDLVVTLKTLSQHFKMKFIGKICRQGTGHLQWVVKFNFPLDSCSPSFRMKLVQRGKGCWHDALCYLPSSAVSQT